MSKFINIDDPRNYLPCQKKVYQIHTCIPPAGTVVINKLEQYASLRATGNITSYTTAALEQMRSRNPQKFQMLMSLVQQGQAYMTNANTPVVLAGTVGEMWCVSMDKLASAYCFLQQGSPVLISQPILNQRIKDGLMDWTVVQSKGEGANVKYGCCQVPATQKGYIQTSWGATLAYNAPGVAHGAGDYILCSVAPNGMPNLADRWVVNGDIFLTTYKSRYVDNKGLIRKTGYNINDLPKLFERQINVWQNA